jgi:hypothetical protein
MDERQRRPHRKGPATLDQAATQCVAGPVPVTSAAKDGAEGGKGLGRSFAVRCAGGDVANGLGVPSPVDGTRPSGRTTNPGAVSGTNSRHGPRFSHAALRSVGVVTAVWALRGGGTDGSSRLIAPFPRGPYHGHGNVPGRSRAHPRRRSAPRPRDYCSSDRTAAGAPMKAARTLVIACLLFAWQVTPAQAGTFRNPGDSQSSA